MNPRPLKDLLLPREHGAWGMLAEPLIVGLIAAPSFPASALVTLAAFFARRPLMLGFFNRAAKADGSSPAACGLAIGLSLFALLLIATAILSAPNPTWLLITIAIAAVLGLVQLRFDVQRQGRSLAAELSGAFALAALAPMLVLVHTDAPDLALTLGLLVVRRPVTPKHLGFIELTLGLTFALLLGLSVT